MSFLWSFDGLCDRTWEGLACKRITFIYVLIYLLLFVQHILCKCDMPFLGTGYTDRGGGDNEKRMVSYMKYKYGDYDI
jgi:hypothetical protein